MRCFIAVFILTVGFATARVEPALPSGDKEERARMIEDGWMTTRLLLNFEEIPGEKEIEVLPLSIENPTAEELAEAPEDENDIADEYLTAYFEAKPAVHLVDPQNLIATREQKDLEEFLKYHAEDCSIDIYVYVFGANQRIPSDVREEEIVERLYSTGKPAAVIYYYIGAPQRSAIYLSPVITDSVSAAEQRRSLESSMMQALSHTDPFDQIDAFLIQMSIRIYWMQRMIQGTAKETMESIPHGENLQTLSRSEVEQKDAPKIPSWMKLLGVIIAAGFASLLTLWIAVTWWRSKMKFRFPEFEVESRLGGGHAAGIGAVISFGRPAIPPAMQRNRVPDYMRRA